LRRIILDLHQIAARRLVDNQTRAHTPDRESSRPAASRLNLTQEHFSRILREIQAAGLIEVVGREIRIIDAGRLHAYPG
jgi:CRP-like cAMP-binding protein